MEDEEPTMPNPPLQWKFDLLGSTPVVDVAGGTIREANSNAFPALQGNNLAVYLLDMETGAIRIPHWHPNAAEVDYVLSGECEVTIVSPSDEHVKVRLKAGEITVIPQGWFHYIATVGDAPVSMLVIFSNDQPNDIGLSRGCQGIPDAVLGLTFAVSGEQFKGIQRDIGFIAPQTGKPKS
jgi:oxalate decarboxylase